MKKCINFRPFLVKNEIVEHSSDELRHYQDKEANIRSCMLRCADENEDFFDQKEEEWNTIFELEYKCHLILYFVYSNLISLAETNTKQFQFLTPAHFNDPIVHSNSLLKLCFIYFSFNFRPIMHNHRFPPDGTNWLRTYQKMINRLAWRFIPTKWNCSINYQLAIMKWDTVCHLHLNKI